MKTIIYCVSCADELIMYNGAISRRILRNLVSCHRLMFTLTTRIRCACLILIWWKLPFLQMKFIDFDWWLHNWLYRKSVSYNYVAFGVILEVNVVPGARNCWKKRGEIGKKRIVIIMLRSIGAVKRQYLNI